MPQLTSPLSTPTGMPATNQAHLGKLAGTRIHFALFADFTAAITTGTAFYAADLWADGQEMTIASEADSGAVRIWRTSLGHARTVRVGRVDTVLPGNSNVVLAAAGQPVSGTGNNGDLSVDRAAGIVYLKTTGAWASVGNVASLSAATASAVEAAKAAGSTFMSAIGPFADVGSLPAASGYTAGQTAYLANGDVYEVLNGAWVKHVFGGGGGSAESYTVVSVATVSTSATPTGGATVAPASAACTGIIVRCRAVAVEYQRNGAGAFYRLAPFENHFIVGITDASQIGFRRTDYATARTTQTTSLQLTLINTSATYSATTLLCTATANSTYQAFGSLACTALWVKNNGGKRIHIKVNAGANLQILNPNEHFLFTGITNANQISIVAFDSNGGASAVGVTFQATPGLPIISIRKADVISENAIISLDEKGGYLSGLQGSFAMPSFFAPFTRFKKCSRSISVFQTVANSNITGGTSANTALAGDETYATWCPNAQFGAHTAVTNTFTGGTTNSYTSNINTTVALNVTSADIHVTLQRIGAGGTVSAINIDLFSAGTPASPGADFHTLDIYPDVANGKRFGLSPDNGFGAAAYGINRFAASGAGATLTAITFARIRVTGTSGLVIRPGEVAVVKRAAAKASVVFTFDDNHASPITDAFSLLSGYGFPGVLYPSPNAGATGGNTGTAGTIPIDNMLSLQHKHGWQIGMQDWSGEQTNDMTADQWLIEQQKNLIQAAALGFDLDGLRDGSYYGAGPYYITGDQYKAAQKIWASGRQFYSGQTADPTDGVTPFNFCDTNPPGDPWTMKALNINGYTPASGNATGIYNHYKQYLDQAIACNGVAVYAAHRDWNDANIYSAMQTLCTFLDANRATVQVVTFKELRRQSQLVTL